LLLHLQGKSFLERFGLLELPLKASPAHGAEHPSREQAGEQGDKGEQQGSLAVGSIQYSGDLLHGEIYVLPKIRNSAHRTKRPGQAAFSFAQKIENNLPKNKNKP
jgi:hypothetical protein